MKLERIAFALIFSAVAGTFIFFASTNTATAPEATKDASTTAAAGPTHGKKLVFSDEFDGQTLSRQNWSTCYDWRKPTETGCTNSGNFEQQWYTEDQLSVQDGNLVLTAAKQAVDVSVQGQSKTFAYKSGMVNSGKGSTVGSARWVGTYGYYEAKMFVSKGQGVWPAFWLLPVDGEWPPEIDVMEFLGNKPSQVLQTVHWRNNDKPAKSDEAITANPDYSADWHTYGVDWEPSKIDWYIDGKKTRTFSGTDVPSKPMEIIIDLAIGGLLPGNADASTPFPRELKVDYVRVYQPNDQVRPRY